ncbi:MAG: hypothetical protein H6810_10265 [Phycisphaeraceae bacterium]|nr:MAG: hypothetical protein H6810_10265 [Phycisphaeraceae bacterium]
MRVAITVLLAALFVGLIGGCATSPEGRRGPVIASARPVFTPGAGFALNRGLGERLGADAVWDATDGSGDRVVLSRTAKSGEVPSSLGAYAAFVDSTFRGQIVDRELHLVALDESNAGLARLAEHHVPWIAIAYTRDAHTDASVRGAACDSAAVIMDFGSAFWTLSWNAARGTLDEREGAMSGFLASLEVTPDGAGTAEGRLRR